MQRRSHKWLEWNNHPVPLLDVYQRDTGATPIDRIDSAGRITASLARCMPAQSQDEAVACANLSRPMPLATRSTEDTGRGLDQRRITVSKRLFSYLAYAINTAVLATPGAALAVAPVDSSGASTPSDPKVNPQASPTEPTRETPSGSPMMGTTGSGPPSASTSGGSETSPSNAPNNPVSTPVPGGASGPTHPAGEAGSTPK